MEIVPTLRMYRDTSVEFATKYMWWFFLIQNAPLPERMIGADPEFFLDYHFQVQGYRGREDLCESLRRPSTAKGPGPAITRAARQTI